MKRIKGVSARRINQHLGVSGSVWQAEYLDRTVRDDQEFEEKLTYIEQNPIRAGLADERRSYEWYIMPPAGT